MQIFKVDDSGLDDLTSLFANASAGPNEGADVVSKNVCFIFLIILISFKVKEDENLEWVPTVKTQENNADLDAAVLAATVLTGRFGATPVKKNDDVVVSKVLVQ